MKIGVAYFSGTDVTKIVAQSIYNRLIELGKEAELIDITPKSAREAFSPASYDRLIMGFPVYSDFAPPVINEWLAELKGEGKPCALFCTYGARTSGYFHYHTWQLMKGAGFKVLICAEFLGRHTFNVADWEILPDRPDNSDLLIAAELADKACELFDSEKSEPIHLQRPMGYKEKLAVHLAQKPSAEKKPSQPFRRQGPCSMCRLCEQTCPTGAFDADSGNSDPEKCIMCQRCLFHCPDGVIVLDEKMYRSYEGFINEWGLTKEIMEKKKSKLILHAWDTVQ
jgi:Fe-S-cluster-containing hydrogenase component 2/flavodoxin